MEKKETFWSNLDPNLKKIITLVGLVSFLLFGAYLLTKDDKPRTRNNEVANVLTDVRSKDMGIESLLAQIKISNDNVNRLENEIKRMTREQELIRSENTRNKSALSRVSQLEKDFKDNKLKQGEQISVLSEKLTRQTEENKQLKKALEGTYDPTTGKANVEFKDFQDASTKPIGEEDLESLYVTDKENAKAKKPSFSELGFNNQNNRPKDFLDQQVDLNDPDKLYATAPLPGQDTTISANVSPQNYDIPSNLKISVYSEQKKESVKHKIDEKESEIFIPAGSMIKGVLLAGLDAPTGTNSRKDPFPVQVRIQHDAILPNGYKADVKECFLLMSGYGDMSTERALLRGENLSCIRDDGAIIQAKLPSYVTGEDGKAGMRGRLVSRTGAMLAKTLLAGFVSGVSKAFDVNMTPTLNTSSDGTVSYEKVYSPSAVQGAAVSGVSTALDKLADYYMSMAEEMFPIIEIDAGREVTVVVTNGATLSVVRDANGKMGNKSQKLLTDEDDSEMAKQ